MDAYRYDLLEVLWSDSFYPSGLDNTVSREYSDSFGSREGIAEKQNILCNFHVLLLKIKISLTAPNVFVRGRRWALVLKNSLLTFFFCMGKEGSLVPTYQNDWKLTNTKIIQSQFRRKHNGHHTPCFEVDKYRQMLIHQPRNQHLR